MNGWIVTSTLSDTYGEINDTLAQTPDMADAFETVQGKVDQYAGSLWHLIAHGDNFAEFTHTESGAHLRVAADFGPMAVATYF